MISIETQWFVAIIGGLALGIGSARFDVDIKFLLMGLLAVYLFWHLPQMVTRWSQTGNLLEVQVVTVNYGLFILISSMTNVVMSRWLQRRSVNVSPRDT